MYRERAECGFQFAQQVTLGGAGGIDKALGHDDAMAGGVDAAEADEMTHLQRNPIPPVGIFIASSIVPPIHQDSLHLH